MQYSATNQLLATKPNLGLALGGLNTFLISTLNLSTAFMFKSCKSMFTIDRSTRSYRRHISILWTPNFMFKTYKSTYQNSAVLP